MPVPESKASAPAPAPADPPSASTELLTRRSAGLGLLAIFGFALLHSRLVYAPCDDAYIFFVYAKNLVEGNGLTFNGELVWGFTSTVWVLLVSLIGLLDIPIHAGAEVLSQIAGGFALWATYRLGRALLLSRLKSLLPALLLAATGDFAFYIGNGLEQALFLGLAMSATALLLRGGQVRFPRLAGIAAVMAAAILTRPEGVLLCGLLLLFWAVRLGQPATPVACGLLVVAFVAPVYVPLCAYFGELLPNTFYAKSDAGLANLRHGIGYLARFLPRFLPVFLAIGLGLFHRRIRWPEQSRRDSSWLLCMAGVWFACIVLRGGDNMVGGRAFLPVLPFLLVAAIELFREVAVRRLAGLFVLIGGLMFLGYRLDPWVTRHAEDWRWAYRVRQAAGTHLRERYPPDTLVALNPAGVIPYISGMRTIDMLGLNDRHIAREGGRDRSLRFGHQAGDGAYVLSRKPDVILFVALSARPGLFISDREIWASPRFHEEYVPVRWTGIGTAYVRKDKSAE